MYDVTALQIKEVRLIMPQKFGDQRGFFQRFFERTGEKT